MAVVCSAPAAVEIGLVAAVIVQEAAATIDQDVRGMVGCGLIVPVVIIDLGGQAKMAVVPENLAMTVAGPLVPAKAEAVSSVPGAPVTAVGPDVLATTIGPRDQAKAVAASAGVPAIGPIIGPIEFQTVIAGTTGETTIAKTSGTTGITIGTTIGTTAITGTTTIGGLTTTGGTRTTTISITGAGPHGQR